MSELAGKWRHYQDEKFGDYLKALGKTFRFYIFGYEYCMVVQPIG